MIINYSVIAYRNKNENVLVLASGERNELTKLLPTIKAIVPEAKIISMDETDYRNCQNDIEELNEFLSDKL